MDPAERARRLAGLQAIVTARNPGEWLDEQLDDIAKKAAAPASARLGSDASRRGDHGPRSALRWYHRPPLMAQTAPIYDLMLMLDLAAEDDVRAKIVADARAAIAAEGDADRRAAVGRAPARLPDRPPHAGRVPPAPVHRPAVADRVARAHAADHRRRRAPPRDQAAARRRAARPPPARPPASERPQQARRRSARPPSPSPPGPEFSSKQRRASPGRTGGPSRVARDTLSATRRSRPWPHRTSTSSSSPGT